MEKVNTSRQVYTSKYRAPALLRVVNEIDHR